ncbi:GIY-YIG nuclease family protein [Aphanothece sacrum]|uniref:Excinuclease ABC subunit C n=1 Tax=Aphanothece sacrum FPU1 TaxID=1920663 RepID=A0A401IBX0_APHSA|nr:GIY-YIG nuclease family protein [Aphanothece sacrum]GBF78745.1 excinuclease ABC subunit C [Aphanothece sacrum FPU1]GBF82977.1 excinuclease ABC subunit C [Aphanothece sacrum FPU3]
MTQLSNLPLVQELGTVRLNNLETLPEDSGVYLVADDTNKVYYIGQSSNLNMALLTHNRLFDFQAVNASKISYLVCDETELIEIELDYINYYNPPLNAGISLEQIKISSVSGDLTPEQQIERYLEICTIIKELEQEKESLKQNIVTFASDYKRERGQNLTYKGVTIFATERKIWQYSEQVKELEEKLKQLKKQEEKNGLAQVAKISVYPTVKGNLIF